MAGNRVGGLKAAAANKLKHGESFYADIGRIGGQRGTTGGFGAGEAGKELARRAGALGGRKSRRGKVVK